MSMSEITSETQGKHELNDDVPILTWLHLSDVHFGHPNVEHGFNRKIVTQHLNEDIKILLGHGVPRPQFVFLTGDIAHNGAPIQYKEALDWLSTVAKTLQLGLENFFCVPGNHDVERMTDDTDVRVMRKNFQDGTAAVSLDEVLNSTGNNNKLIRSRLSGYLDFARNLRFAESTPQEDELYWVCNLDLPIPVRIAGLNTAMLCFDGSDQGKLRVGMRQLNYLLNHDLRDDARFTIFLSHHPNTWLADGPEVDKQIKNRAHLYLYGHVHDSNVQSMCGAANESLLSIAANPVHGDLPTKIPASHGYNIGSLVQLIDGTCKVKVWPRRWSDKLGRFIVDAENVLDGKQYAKLPVPFRFQQPDSVLPEVTSLLVGNIGPRKLHFAGLYRHGRELDAHDCLGVLHAQPPKELPRDWLDKSSPKPQRDLYLKTGRHMNSWIRDLNFRLSSLNQGVLIRTVLDVVHGGVFYCYLDNGYYLIGATLIQEDMSECDKLMGEMQDMAIKAFGFKAVNDSTRTYPSY
jgi:predicted MPP superfamily phosphohydrolase